MAGWGETVFKRHFLDKCRIKSSSHSRSESLHKEGSNQNFRAFIKSLKSEHIHSFLGRLKTLSCSLNMAFINCVAMKKKMGQLVRTTQESKRRNAALSLL